MKKEPILFIFLAIHFSSSSQTTIPTDGPMYESHGYVRLDRLKAGWKQMVKVKANLLTKMIILREK